MNRTADSFSVSVLHYAGRISYSDTFFTKLARTLKIGEDTSILDLACGGGEICQGLSPYAGHILGVDFSDPMLELAAALALPNVTLINHDLNQHAVKTDSDVDLVTIGRAIPYLDRALLKETLSASLKQGGLVMICGAGLAPETPWSKQYQQLRHKYRTSRTHNDFQGRKAMDSIGFNYAGTIGHAINKKFLLNDIVKHSLSYNTQTQAILDDMGSFTALLVNALAPFQADDGSYPGIEVSWAHAFRK